MHLLGSPYIPNVVASVAVAMGAVDRVGAVDAVEAVEAVETVEAVEAEIITRVSVPIATLPPIVKMHAESGHALRREEPAEESTSAFAPSVGSKVRSKSIASPTTV
jgi:hypothetical protein